MKICVAGDTHGAIDQLYSDVLTFEDDLGLEFDWLLHVGDFGIWPSPDRVDKATRKHGGAGDFPRWWSNQLEAPRRTLFIKGNHEDFDWLEGQWSSEILPNLFYLKNGRAVDLGDGITVGGVGGCFGPSNYSRRSRDLQGRAKRHYTRGDIDALVGRRGIDLLLTHDAPAGVVFPTHRHGRNWMSEAIGLDDLVRQTKPLMAFFGHHHTQIVTNVATTTCIGLNRVGMPGHLVALDLDPRDKKITVLGLY